jgi:hypothetical protein
MTKRILTNIAARHFSGVSLVDGVSLLAFILSRGGSPFLKVPGKSFCVSCLDFCYTCLHTNFVQRWYDYQARTNEAPGFPLRTGFNGLEVDHWVDQKLLSDIVLGGFVVPELDPNAANAAQAGGGEGNDN